MCSTFILARFHFGVALVLLRFRLVSAFDAKKAVEQRTAVGPKAVSREGIVVVAGPGNIGVGPAHTSPAYYMT